MMHFKNHKHGYALRADQGFAQRADQGFTIIETVLALVITGLILTPVFILHGALLQRVNRSSRSFNALLAGKHFLYEARQKQEPEAQTFLLEKIDDESGAKLHYELQAGLDKKSPLHSCVGLHKETVTIKWTEQGQSRQEKLVTFVYKQPEQKKQ